MTALTILRTAGLLSVQDMGRPGHLAQGLARGGAMDRMALIEAARLLGAPAPLASIEMAGAGGDFSVDRPTRVALTGAPMAAKLDGAPLRWNVTHRIEPGQRLSIGGAQAGVYGYLTPAGGLATAEWLGSRAAHLSIGIFAPLQPGDTLSCGDDPDPARPSRAIIPEPRFAGGELRIMDGPQSALFADETLAAFFATEFRSGTRANRQGMQIEAERRFSSDHAAGLASEVIGPGDVQMTGDGVPYVLMAECQTVGGYPRIGTVIPADLPKVAQAAPGTPLCFRRIGLDEVDRLTRTDAALWEEAARRCTNLVRDPHDIPDLLAYQLVSGMVRGDEEEG